MHRPETADYVRPVPSYLSEDEVMTVQDYLSDVEDDLLMDYDGYGYPVRDGLEARTAIYPSDGMTTIPKDATHISWYNK